MYSYKVKGLRRKKRQTKKDYSYTLILSAILGLALSKTKANSLINFDQKHNFPSSWSAPLHRRFNYSEIMVQKPAMNLLRMKMRSND
jgi:hypothetical protein